MNRKMHTLFIVMMVALVGAGLYFGVKTIGQAKENQVIGTVNGKEISQGLFMERVRENRAGTYAYFQEKYGVDEEADFWNKEFGGEVPAEFLKQQALDDCVFIMVQQEMALEKGIISDMSYDSFLQDLKNENERRKQAISQGKVIYGPVEYTEENYFTYVFSNMVIELKRAMAQELMPEDEEIYREYQSRPQLQDRDYEEVKDALAAKIIDKKYDQLVAEKIEEAELEIDREIIEGISTEY